MSEVKVNKISPRSGTTVTLGDSGDTFTIPSGATINNQGTATNFGATGSASWNTTVKTGDFTACLLYTSPSPRDRQKSRMPSSA